MISLPYHTNLSDNAIKCFILYYSDEENESQRDYAIYWKLHSWQMVKQAFEPNSLVFTMTYTYLRRCGGH